MTRRYLSSSGPMLRFPREARAVNFSLPVSSERSWPSRGFRRMTGDAMSLTLAQLFDFSPLNPLVKQS